MAQQILYFADPMCSWCWGFSPVVDAIQKKFGDDLPVRLLLGGLRPGTTEPLDGKSKDSIREHWDHVHDATGQPFDHAFFEREGFVYDTEPPSRAIVAMYSLADGASLPALKRLHRAFYAENRDITDAQVLADLAVELGHDRQSFEEAFEAADIIKATQGGFEFSRNAGIGGFPTMVAGSEDNGYRLLTTGYRPWSDIESLLEPQPVES